MIETGVGIFAFLAAYALVTLGGVLLVHLIRPRASHGRKTVLGALLGPLALWLAILPIADITGDYWVAVPVFTVIILGMCFVIGWPLSHFANKRLHSLSSLDVEIFE